MKRIISIILTIMLLAVSSNAVLAAEQTDVEICDLTDVIELFPEAEIDAEYLASENRIIYDKTSFVSKTYIKENNGIVYSLDMYNDKTFILTIEYPAVLVSSTRSIDQYTQQFSYYYPLPESFALMTATVRYTYNTSTGVNTITSCVGGGSDISLYGHGVYSGKGKVWGNAMYEGYAVAGLTILVSPKTDGSRGLTKTNTASMPF